MRFFSLRSIQRWIVVAVTVLILSVGSIGVLGTASAAPMSRVSSSPTRSAAPTPPGLIVGKPFTLPNCFQPPANVDHASLSNADLIKYGLPPRAGFRSQAEWAMVVRRALYRSCTAIPTNELAGAFSSQAHSQTTHSLNSLYAGSAVYNTQWAGWVQKSNNWVYSNAYWTVPIVTCQNNIDTASSQWVGIGGWQNDRLVQDGSEGDATHIAGFCVIDQHAWVENAGNNPARHYPGYNSNYDQYAYNLFRIGRGDTMFGEVNQSPGHVYMYVADLTSGMNGSMEFGPTPNPGTFECIDEAPSAPDGSVKILAQTSAIPYTLCEAEYVDQTWHDIGDNNYLYFACYITSNGQQSGQPYADPNFPGNGDFTVTWHGNGFPPGP